MNIKKIKLALGVTEKLQKTQLSDEYVCECHLWTPLEQNKEKNDT